MSGVEEPGKGLKISQVSGRCARLVLISGTEALWNLLVWRECGEL